MLHCTAQRPSTTIPHALKNLIFQEIETHTTSQQIKNKQKSNPILLSVQQICNRTHAHAEQTFLKNIYFIVFYAKNEH